MGRLSTTALNIVSPSTYFERTSAVNTTLPDDAVQLHHCLSVVHHRVDGLGQSQIFEFDLTWISGEEVSAQGYANAYWGMGILRSGLVFADCHFSGAPTFSFSF